MTAPELEVLPLVASTEDRGEFTAQQVRQLLAPINPRRVVASDGKGNPHLSQQDVTAHLIRVFGFGHFDVEVVRLDCLFEHNRPTQDGKPGNRWDVGYRAVVRLTVRDPEQRVVCVYEDGSTGTAENQKLGDAHDLAMKSAISLAKKRAAVYLGDQYGLSLYNHGQRDALVIATLVDPNRELEQDEDVQQGVAQQQEDPEVQQARAAADEPAQQGRVTAAEIAGGAQ